MRDKAAASVAIVGWRTLKDLTMEPTSGRSHSVASAWLPSPSTTSPLDSKCQSNAERRKGCHSTDLSADAAAGGSLASTAEGARLNTVHDAFRQPASSSNNASASKSALC